jgi:hypothetical protein
LTFQKARRKRRSPQFDGKQDERVAGVTALPAAYSMTGADKAGRRSERERTVSREKQLTKRRTKCSKIYQAPRAGAPIPP